MCNLIISFIVNMERRCSLEVLVCYQHVTWEEVQKCVLLNSVQVVILLTSGKIVYFTIVNLVYHQVSIINFHLSKLRHQTELLDPEVVYLTTRSKLRITQISAKQSRAVN